MRSILICRDTPDKAYIWYMDLSLLAPLNRSKKIPKETEIVGVDDFMTEICWTGYFIGTKV